MMILARGLASAIATPVFLVDPDGTLAYYNEAAEVTLGRSFAEAGALKPGEWGTMWQPEDVESEAALAPEHLPLSIALEQRVPAHGRLRITGLDDEKRTIAVTAFPLFAKTDEFVGAVAIFWEEKG